jgi:hypothetical protein
MGGVVLSYLGVRNIHQWKVRRLVLVQSMSVRDFHRSEAYRFLVTISLLTLLEASFKLLDSKVEGTIILKTFSMKDILHWGKQPETRGRGRRYKVFQLVGLSLPVPQFQHLAQVLLLGFQLK